MLPILQGHKVTLREIERDDWTAVHKYASQDIVSTYQPWGPNSEEDSIRYVTEAIEEAKKSPRDRFVFAIMNNQTSGMIGAGELHIKSRTNKEAEIGYVLHPDSWGKGYATETANLLLDFGFNDLNLHRIFATCDPRNIGSEKVLINIGMKLEGRIRESILLNDGWRDSLLFSLLEQEWLIKNEE